MEIIHASVDKLIPYIRNPRKNEQAISKVAGSISEFGFKQPIVVDSNMVIIVGHTRFLAAQQLELKEVPVVIANDLTEAQVKAYRIADNRTAQESSWDFDLLKLEMEDLTSLEFDLLGTAFDQAELDDMLRIGNEGFTDPDEVPDTPDEPTTELGDIYILGNHRLMCGDSTNAEQVKRLMDGHKAQLIHSDPPYGMGKEKDGVANDNLYVEKLDKFQMSWWNTFRKYIEDNASVYIWGTAEDLWRLWYSGGLNKSERLTMRNEIAWKKESCVGQLSGSHRQYPTITERCIFFMLGSQNFGNINTEDFWEGFEPLRAYLEGEALKMGWKASDIMQMCGVGMYSHWFTKAQWTFIPENHYQTLQTQADGHAFTKTYAELKSGHTEVKVGGKSLDKKHSFDAMRAFFDNTHDKMSDIWEYSRVLGDERHDHATPKPVEMMKRIMCSSLEPGELCAEPFGGSGSTLMGAEITGRRCFTMELKPVYCDVIVKRWEDYTGHEAIIVNQVADTNVG